MTSEMKARVRELELDGFVFSVSDRGFALAKDNTPVYAVDNWPHLPDEAPARQAVLWEAAVECATEYQNILSQAPAFPGMGI